jgi:hypothetical protein
VFNGPVKFIHQHTVDHCPFSTMQQLHNKLPLAPRKRPTLFQNAFKVGIAPVNCQPIGLATQRPSPVDIRKCANVGQYIAVHSGPTGKNL